MADIVALLIKAAAPCTAIITLHRSHHPPHFHSINACGQTALAILPYLLPEVEAERTSFDRIIIKMKTSFTAWMYIMDAQVGLKAIALTLFLNYFSISFLQLLCVMISILVDSVET